MSNPLVLWAGKFRPRKVKPLSQGYKEVRSRARMGARGEKKKKCSSRAKSVPVLFAYPVRRTSHFAFGSKDVAAQKGDELVVYP